jgi:hypothetical protein
VANQFSAEKLPVSFAQMVSPLRIIRFLSVVECCTQPANLDTEAAAEVGVVWLKHGIVAEQIQRANIRVAALRFIATLPGPPIGPHALVHRRLFNRIGWLFLQMGAEVVGLCLQVPKNNEDGSSPKRPQRREVACTN